ncbi:MAG: 16S rRNA (guanine(966)-N(2))-methyltransferase RsmD [Evtepia sp.]
MRVISGTARGRRLEEPLGLDTRPTTDRVKESIFNIIQFELEGRRVLDLFSGTGQLGIEALSRGAAHCTFVDLRREAILLTRKNLERTGFDTQAALVQGDFQTFLRSTQEKFDVILIDPPYHTDLLEKAMTLISTVDNSSENGIIVCEKESSSDWPTISEPYCLEKDYRYGKTGVALYRRRV